MTATLLAVVAVVVAHEAGHVAAAWALRLRPRVFVRWNAIGVRVPAACPEAELLIAVAGPCASVMAAVPLLAAHMTLAAWWSVALAVENLVPVRVFGVATDGLHARRAIRQLATRQETR